MNEAAKKLWKQIQSLPREQQLEIAQRVYDEDVDPEWEAACLEVVRERMARWEAGETQGYTLEEVRQRFSPKTQPAGSDTSA